MALTASPTVALDVTPLLGARTGIGSAVAEIVHALSALDDPPRLVPYTLSFRARNLRGDAPPQTRFVPVPARFLLRSWTRSEVPRIDRWLKPAQVMHATNYLTPPSRLPTVVSVYDCSFVRYPELCTPEVRAFEPIVRRAIARGATVHTGSEFVADEIEEIFARGLRAAGRLVVIPLGIPARAEVASLPAPLESQLGGAPYVLAIGTLEPRKNYPHLVQAFGFVAQEHSDVRLVIAGHDGPARAGVDAALSRLRPEVRARVLLPGGVSDTTKRALLERATVLAYPSIYEGFGFPVLEAMAAGVPVVAARAGSIPEVAGDAAVLVEPTDEQKLAQEIGYLLGDEAARADLVNRGRRQIVQFSWTTTARELATLYRELA